MIRKRIEKELLVAGEVDAQGDSFTREALQAATDDPRPLLVTLGFDPRMPPVGRVVSKRMDGDRLMVTLELDERGEEEVGKGFEAAAAGSVSCSARRRPVIDDFRLVGVGLTDKKVK